MGVLIKGLGVDRVCWGTDALWTGSPQWQIEGLGRLEIPEDLQKRFGSTPLGDAQGPHDDVQVLQLQNVINEVNPRSRTPIP
jgi:hypothetical protein